MSNEHRAVYAEASLPNGTTATLLPGHVVVFSDMAHEPTVHIGVARWLGTVFVNYEGLSLLPEETLTELEVALTKAITRPWVVFRAKETQDGAVRLCGLNLWTGGEFYWVHNRKSFDPKSYQTSLYDWTRATFDPEAYALLLSWGVTLP